MIDYINYYEILELPEFATQQEIKEAFRHLAQQYHPDKIPDHLIKLRHDAEEKFKQINEAYKVLSDPRKRSQYDNLLRSFRQQSSSDSSSSQAPTVPPVTNAFVTSQRKRFHNYWAIVYLVGILLVGIILIVYVINKSDRQQDKLVTTIPQTKNQPNSSTPLPNETFVEKIQQPVPRVARIEGIMYSFTKERWAITDIGGAYPDVGMRFASGLIYAPSVVRWKGSYSVTSSQLYLQIDNFSVPESEPLLPEFYTDIGVGYNVTLENAVFEDYAMSRTAILFRTFVGDSPPSKINKCYSINVVPKLLDSSYVVYGEWEGNYNVTKDDSLKETVYFIARFVQDGNHFDGVMLESNSPNVRSSDAGRSRARVTGMIVDERITFQKTYKDRITGVSYVSNKTRTGGFLQGNWFAGFSHGTWEMSRRGDFVGSPDDILSEVEESRGQYIDNSDGTITDTSTGLMWTKADSREAMGRGMNWDESKSWVDSLTVGGHNDWRMPTLVELKSIYDESYKVMACNNDANTPLHMCPLFASGGAYWLWSSEDAGSGYSRYMGFHNGVVDTARRSYVKYSVGARGVRLKDESVKAEPPKEESVGNVQYGHYIDNGDGTITDTSTGLMWTKADSRVVTGHMMNWYESKAWSDGLTVGGHTDWRMPTIAELKSIYDKSYKVLAYDNDTNYPLHMCPLFASGGAYGYWSIEDAGSGYSRYMLFTSGVIRTGILSKYAYDMGVRGVRSSGQSLTTRLPKTSSESFYKKVQEQNKTFEEQHKLNEQNIHNINATQEMLNTTRGILMNVKQSVERDYYVFQLEKKSGIIRIKDVGLRLDKTNKKKQRCNILILYDDKNLQKKDLDVNTSINFSKMYYMQAYEVVITTVADDMVAGYLSIPKMKN